MQSCVVYLHVYPPKSLVGNIHVSSAAAFTEKVTKANVAQTQGKGTTRVIFCVFNDKSVIMKENTVYRRESGVKIKSKSLDVASNLIFCVIWQSRAWCNAV